MKRYAFQITIRDDIGEGNLSIEIKNISGYEFDHEKDEPTAAIVVVDKIIDLLNEEAELLGEGITHDA